MNLAYLLVGFFAGMAWNEYRRFRGLRVVSSRIREED